MKRLKQKLSSEEKEILDAFESGKLRSITHLATEKRRFQNIAKAWTGENQSIDHIKSWDGFCSILFNE